MADTKVEVISHRKEFDAAFERCVDKALHMVGGLCESTVKEVLTENQSVDTGLLRNSITYALAGEPPNIQSYVSDDGTKSGSYSGNAPVEDDENHKSVYVGTNVEYAPYVELGHSQEPGRYVPKLGKRLVASWVNGKPYLRPGVERASTQFHDIFLLCFGELDE